MAKRVVSELFVSRLSFYTTTEELKRLFSPFGVVKEARLIKDPITQRHKGFGFVKFWSEIEAQNAMKAMNGRLAYMGYLLCHASLMIITTVAYYTLHTYIFELFQEKKLVLGMRIGTTKKHTFLPELIVGGQLIFVEFVEGNNIPKTHQS